MAIPVNIVCNKTCIVCGHYVFNVPSGDLCIDCINNSRYNPKLAKKIKLLRKLNKI